MTINPMVLKGNLNQSQASITEKNSQIFRRFEGSVDILGNQAQ